MQSSNTNNFSLSPGITKNSITERFVEPYKRNRIPFSVPGRVEDHYYMDGYLRENLDLLKRINKKDWDFVIIVSSSGIPRVGKSVLAQQIGYYLDDNGFDLSNVCPSAEKFQKRAKEIFRSKKKGVALVYDEAKFGLDARRAMETVTKALLDFFAECGQLNAYLILVLPDYFDLKKEMCLNRSICLINCEYKNEFERGYFKFYSRVNKKMLYMRGKEYHNYNAYKCNFSGRFYDFYTIDEKGYRKQKSDYLINGQASQTGATTTALRKQRNELINWLFINVDLPVKEIARLVGITPRGVNMIISNGEGEQRNRELLYFKEGEMAPPPLGKEELFIPGSNLIPPGSSLFPVDTKVNLDQDTLKKALKLIKTLPKTSESLDENIKPI